MNARRKLRLGVAQGPGKDQAAAAARYSGRGALTMLLSNYEMLNASHQIERLRHQLSQVQKGEAFLLHAGDCAESFDACTQVRQTFALSTCCHLFTCTGKHLEQNRTHPVLLAHPHLGSPPTNRQCEESSLYRAYLSSLTSNQVRIGRIAGQYAKPRSSAKEKIGDREVLSFRYDQLVSIFVHHAEELIAEAIMSTGEPDLHLARRYY